MRALVARLFWLAMIVGHMPAIVSTYNAAGVGELSFARLSLLVVSQVCFVLKLIDVRWLRLPADRHATLAVVSVLVLLHAGVVGRAAAGQADDAPVWQVLRLGGTLAALGALVGGRRPTVARIRPRRVRCEAHAVLRRLRSAWLDAWLPPRDLFLQRACAVYRAPPR